MKAIFPGQTPVPPRSRTWILDQLHGRSDWLGSKQFHQHHDRIHDHSTLSYITCVILENNDNYNIFAQYIMLRLHIHGSDTDTITLLSVIDGQHPKCQPNLHPEVIRTMLTHIIRSWEGCSRTWWGWEADMARTARMQCENDTNMTWTAQMRHGQDIYVIKTIWTQSGLWIAG